MHGLDHSRYYLDNWQSKSVTRNAAAIASGAEVIDLSKYTAHARRHDTRISSARRKRKKTKG